jgi:hypothetical protein
MTANRGVKPCVDQLNSQVAEGAANPEAYPAVVSMLTFPVEVRQLE